MTGRHRSPDPRPPPRLGYRPWIAAGAVALVVASGLAMHYGDAISVEPSAAAPAPSQPTARASGVRGIPTWPSLAPIFTDIGTPPSWPSPSEPAQEPSVIATKPSVTTSRPAPRPQTSATLSTVPSQQISSSPTAAAELPATTVTPTPEEPTVTDTPTETAAATETEIPTPELPTATETTTSATSTGRRGRGRR